MDDFSVPAGFGKVWERVTAVCENEEVPLTRNQELEMFIAREKGSIDFYKLMMNSGYFRDKQQTLCRILSDERRHLKNLQMEYFMDTGDTLAEPQADYTENSRDALGMLREAYLAESESARLYAAAAMGRTGDLGELYTANSSDESTHAGILKGMVEKCFAEEM